MGTFWTILGHFQLILATMLKGKPRIWAHAKRKRMAWAATWAIGLQHGFGPLNLAQMLPKQGCLACFSALAWHFTGFSLGFGALTYGCDTRSR